MSITPSKLPSHGYFFLLVLCVYWLVPALVMGQSLSVNTYDIGNPTLTHLWVDPSNGNDQNTGLSSGQPLRTLTAAWAKIPRGQTFTSSGYQVNLRPGTYERHLMPHYWESRYGTFQLPVIIRATDGPATAILRGDMNIYDVRFLYLIDIDIAAGGDAFHCEQCHSVLLRRVSLDGGARTAHETLKINQSQYIYIEDSNIHGAGDNAIDFVAVQYGHVVRNRIHNAEDWCMYVKGGSAYLLVESNEIYNCGTGGFTAGQGTGFEFMTAPWIHYEAYDIKALNNLIHDVEGAGLGVNGGFNILLAHNTLSKVGSRSHAIEVVFGERSCDGASEQCLARNALGGWGPASASDTPQPIPNRNVLIFNNIVYNPAPFQSQYQHLAIYGPRLPSAGTNIPSPSQSDVNLQIRGNIFWNGPAELALGIEEEHAGCQTSNPTCNLQQLLADNLFNTLEPQFIDASSGDFRPALGSNILGVIGDVPGEFSGTDPENSPVAPLGNLLNGTLFDRGGEARSVNSPVPGAYLSSNSRLAPVPGTPGAPPPSDIGEDGPETSPPTISLLKMKRRASKRKGEVQVEVRVVDNISVAQVFLQAGGKVVKLKGKRGKYKGKIKIRGSGTYQIDVRAIDGEGHQNTLQLGTLNIR